MSHNSPNIESTVSVASFACAGVKARICDAVMLPGPPSANVDCTRAVISPNPPASRTTNTEKATVPTNMMPIWTTSVAATLRSPPVDEYSAVTVSISKREIRLLAVRTQPSAASGPTIESGTPTNSTRATTGRKSPAGNHWSHNKNGSATLAAANSTQASETQLMMVPW